MYYEHSDSVFSFALRRIGAEEARDVTADTFRIAWEHVDVLPEQPLPYLYGIARRVVANHRRTLRRRGSLWGRLCREFAAGGPEVRATETDEAAHALVGDDAIAQAAERLSARDRELLQLTYWDDLSADEVAQVLGCSAGAVRVGLHRARQRLARELAWVEERS